MIFTVVLILLSLAGCLGLIWGPRHGIIEITSATLAVAPFMTLILRALGAVR